MRVKKILKADAEKTHARYRNADELNNLKAEFGVSDSGVKTNARNTLFRRLAVTCMSVLIVGASVFCGVYFTAQPSGGNGYNNQDNLAENITLNEIKSSVTAYDISDKLEYVLLQKIYRPDNGATVLTRLKYEEKGSELAETIEIDFFKDPAVEHVKPTAEGGIDTDYYGYTMRYKKSDSSLGVTVYNGYIDTGSERVFIEYNHISLNDNFTIQAFFDFLGKVLLPKSV